MHTKHFKKKLFKKLNPVNFTLSLTAVLVSFVIVSVCGAIQDQRAAASSSTNSLVYSALRIADAFEFYNQKRFDQ